MEYSTEICQKQIDGIEMTTDYWTAKNKEIYSPLQLILITRNSYSNLFFWIPSVLKLLLRPKIQHIIS